MLKQHPARPAPRMFLLVLTGLLLLAPGHAEKDAAVLSNLHLPVDTDGRALLTGETDILRTGNLYHIYVNNWGTCATVDCCPSAGGCASCCYVPATPIYPDACVFHNNHTVVLYETENFQEFKFRGPVLTPKQRPAGIEFRPHVLFVQRTGKYVMWFENRPEAISSSGYFVATSSSAAGPFRVVRQNMSVADVPGDFDLLMDDDADGTCYHVQTTTNDPKRLNGFVVTKLDPTCTKPSSPLVSHSFTAPRPAEGPVFFKRNGLYYILAGTTCCACRGGSSIYVFMAPSPLGPWRYQSDVGSVPGHVYDPHSPGNFVTRAQASAVFPFGPDMIWMGNQWVTSSERNSDLMYWSRLEFNSTGAIEQFQWHDSLVL